MRISSVMLISLALISPVTILLPVRGALCLSPSPMCGPGTGSNASFTLSASPNTVQVYAGGFTVTSSITVTSVNCFAGVVSLQGAASPVTNAPAATLSPTRVSLACNGSATSTLTVSTASTTATGSYTVAVTGGRWSYRGGGCLCEHTLPERPVVLEPVGSLRSQPSQRLAEDPRNSPNYRSRGQRDMV